MSHFLSFVPTHAILYNSTLACVCYNFSRKYFYKDCKYWSWNHKRLSIVITPCITFYNFLVSSLTYVSFLKYFTRRILSSHSIGQEGLLKEILLHASLASHASLGHSRPNWYWSGLQDSRDFLYFFTILELVRFHDIYTFPLQVYSISLQFSY
jgi:hypothetical protein